MLIRTIRIIIFHTISRLKLDSIELKTYICLPRIRPEWRLNNPSVLYNFSPLVTKHIEQQLVGTSLLPYGNFTVSILAQ
jgi:hypothetical protein